MTTRRAFISVVYMMILRKTILIIPAETCTGSGLQEMNENIHRSIITAIAVRGKRKTHRDTGQEGHRYSQRL
jgi:hypothetical protein